MRDNFPLETKKIVGLTKDPKKVFIERMGNIRSNHAAQGVSEF